MMSLSLLLLSLAWPQDDPEPTAAELRAHVEYLASDELAGRRSGTPYADRAAYYIAGAMAAAGLEPAGTDGSWLQAFEIEQPPRPGVVGLTLMPAGSPIRREIPVMGTLAISASAEREAAVVSVGYGTVLESHGINDFEDAQVAGKIVVIRRYSMFGPKPSPELASLGNLRNKLRAAVAAGAVGVILGTHPEDLEKGGEAEISFESVPGTTSIPVVTLPPDQFEFVEAWAKKEEPGRAWMQVEVQRRRVETFNVLGIFNAEQAKNGVIVVGGHYDHLGLGGQGSLAPGVEAIHNGADDNASGIAVILELAETLAAIEWPSQRAVVFAHWGAEELGLLGSRYWMEHPTVAREQLLCNVNLDMVGRLENGRITVGSHETAEVFAPAIEAVQEAVPELQLKMTEGRLPGGGGSDHMSFHKEDVAAIFFFSGLHSDYHKPSDDAEKLAYEEMAVFTRQLLHLMVQLDRAPREQFAYQAPPPPEPREEMALQGERAWFGSIPDYGAEPSGGGMQLSGVSPGGPAEKAGLEGGDIIRQIGEVKVNDIYDFMDALNKYKVGETVSVLVRRDGEARRFFVQLSTRGAQ